nr:diaminopimelate epimerase [Armatimonadota bacterium]
MKFSKMQGLGNDFVLINGFEEKLDEPALVEAAKKVCDRHFGIGADGLIVALPSRIANFRMRIFNPDGSEPEMCGNGIRCFAQYVRQKGLTRESTIEVETLAGIMRPQILGDEADGKLVRVDMGQPRLNRKDIPVRGDTEQAIGDTLKVNGQKYEFTAVSMGNPHCVIFVDDVQNFPVEKIGPQIEQHNLFPRRTNVEFVQVVSNSQVKMRVWERGAGETLA